MSEPELDRDLKKLDEIEAKGRQRYGDDKLTLEDIASLDMCAEKFGVPQRVAYLRAKGLKLLSYQQIAPANTGEKPS